MKTSILSAFLLLFAIFSSKSTSAQSNKNLHSAKVYTLNSKTWRGILTSADEKGIYLVRKLGDSSVFVNATQIKEIKLRRKGKSSTGTTIGFLTGLAAGTGGVIALHSQDRLENTLSVVGAVLLTFTTTAIGGAIASQPDEVIVINGRSEDYLQSLTRIKSFTPALNP